MRILLVSPYFPPQQAIASLRAHSFASAWSSAGVEVTVLTTRKRTHLNLKRSSFGSGYAIV